MTEKQKRIPRKFILFERIFLLLFIWRREEKNIWMVHKGTSDLKDMAILTFFTSARYLFYCFWVFFYFSKGKICLIDAILWKCLNRRKREIQILCKNCFYLVNRLWKIKKTQANVKILAKNSVQKIIGTILCCFLSSQWLSG